MKFCPEEPNLGQKDVQEKGLILEVITDDDWGVSRSHVGTTDLH
jgi:hypothetical protein